VNSEEPLAHVHSHSDVDLPVSRSHKRNLIVGVIIVFVATFVGIISTFPSSAAIDKVSRAAKQTIDFADEQVPAKVDSVTERTCDGQESISEENQTKCKYVLFDSKTREIKPSEGELCVKNQPFLEDESKPVRYCVEQSFDPAGSLSPKFEVGQDVVLTYRDSGGVTSQFRYQYGDNDRRIYLAVLFILFLLAVFIFGLWRGMLAVAGLITSLVIIIVYILPALVTGENGLVVALSGGAAVAAAALYITHGFKNSTHIAFLSSIGSVLTIALLAQIFFTVANFSGFVSEEASFLVASGTGIDIRGLLVAGVILASLGALDDMTVTQVSAVSEIHNARSDYKFAQLWKSAVRIGRDHVASTVNTLALAYVGTSLATMVLFVIANQQLQWVANSEAIAVEITGALIGSIGLIVAVPLSTALAAYAVHQSGEHGHVHDHSDENDAEEKKQDLQK
jgi:uncharacterized membrane protein